MTAPANRTTLDKQLNRVMNYPHLENESTVEGVVYVSFRIDESGNTEIIEMNASDDRLADHVTTKLHDLADVLRENDDSIGQQLT